MTSIIVDTSVVVKWYAQVSEDHVYEARELRKRIVDGDYSLVCTEVIILELINALRIGKKLAPDECIQSVHSFIALCAQLAPTPNVDAIVSVVYQHAMASYDAVFVALAQERNMSLVTADYTHHKKSVSPHIIWLNEWKYTD